MTSLGFASPGYLWLGLILLGFVALTWRSRAGLTRGRYALALGCRLALATLLVLALAEAQMRQINPSLCVIYLLDQSQSIPAKQRAGMFEYVVRDIERFRRDDQGDLAGVIVFGRTAAMEIPPSAEPWRWQGRREVIVPQLEEATDLAAAMRLAQTTFPPDVPRRVVLVTDGNENRGSAREMLAEYRRQGIGVDVVAIPLEREPRVMIERLVLPNRAKQDSMIEAKVVLNNQWTAPPADSNGDLAATGPAGSDSSVRGTLLITRKIGEQSVVVVSQEVDLPAGKSVYSFPHRLDFGSGFYSYEATFSPADPVLRAQTSAAQRRVSAFTNVEGQGRVLLLEDPSSPGRFDSLVQSLRTAGLAVDVQADFSLLGSFEAMQNYDSVVLGDVPRVTAVDDLPMISDQQLELLLQNTELGCGLVLLGGPNSFGAGGWANTRLEEASPVNFTVKNSKVMPAGALMLVVDRSGSMEGDKIVAARQAAMAAIQTLSENDYVGVVAFDSLPTWSVPFQQIGGRRAVLNGLARRISVGGGTDMFPAMQKGYAALKTVNVGVKHMIVLTDGLTPPAEFEGLVKKMRQDGITVSSVAVGDDADRNLLLMISQLGGGKFHNVSNSKLVPRIFMKEALRVTRPLLFEREQAFRPNLVPGHEALAGLVEPLPPIRGYVLTERKNNPLVQVGVTSPLPGDDDVNTIFASWNYGIGRSVVITTDAGQRWATAWPEWEGYGRFYEQIIRWSMRPGGDTGGFNLAAQMVDGKLEVSLTGSGEAGEPLSALDPLGMVVTPDQQLQRVEFQQSSPGRYVAELPVERQGNHFLTVRPGAEYRTITIGVNAPENLEWLAEETNWNLLETLVSASPEDNAGGRLRRDGVLDWSLVAELDDAFRRTLPQVYAVSDIRSALVVLAAITLFLDVAVRRLSVDVSGLRDWLRQTWGQRREPEEAGQTVARLKAKVAEVRQDQVNLPLDDTLVESVEELLSGPRPQSSDPPRFSSAPPGESGGVSEGSAPSYTQRLLDAKRRSRQS